MEEEAGSLHPFPGGCRSSSNLLPAVALEVLRKGLSTPLFSCPSPDKKVLCQQFPKKQ